MNFDRATGIADAVLMEGYALFPYRASALKNRFRWTFGVLAPRAWSEAGGSEAWWLETQLLAAGVPRIAGRLRFFEIVKRETWDDGIQRTIDFDGAAHTPFAIGALQGRISVRTTAVWASPVLTRIAIRIENLTPWSDLSASRDAVLGAAFASTHLLIGVERAELLSLADPPAWARSQVAECINTRTHPVLIGRPPATLALSAPFILQDDPQIAPESAGDTCDGSEIDELLMLATRSLTDEEKREARAIDSRTADIIDRADALSDAQLAAMHGASRKIADDELRMMSRLELGARVCIHPIGRTDAQDVLYAGHVATVRIVRDDVDGTTYYGVTIDDDPAAELHAWYGRYHYYRRAELEVLWRILVAGIGNVLFRDDGFGVEVAVRLSRDPPSGVQVADFGIRALHLGYELLAERDLVVVVDCMRRDGPPGTLYVVEPTAEASELADPHAMNLATVFATLRSLGGKPPPTLVVGCEPESIDPGIGLSPIVTQAIPGAIDLIRGLLARQEVR